MHPVVTDDKKAEAILAWAVDKMEERYEFLRKARVRNIASYNELEWDEIIRRIDPQTEEERAALPREMPSIVIIVDEVGDLLMSMKKDVEGPHHSPRAEVACCRDPPDPWRRKSRPSMSSPA